MAAKGIESLYILSREAGAGSMVLALGVLELLRRHYGRIALFRPIALAGSEDSDIDTLLRYHGMEQSLEETRGVAEDEAEKLVAEQGIKALVEQVLERYEKLRERYDFVLCMGIRMEELSHTIGIDLNVELAKNLSAPIAGVFSAREMETAALEESLQLWSRAIRQQGAEIFMFCANHCSEDLLEWHEEHREELTRRKNFPVCCLPRSSELEHLTIMDLMKHLPIEWIAGEERQRENNIYSFRLGTMELASLLETLQLHEMIITSSDRSDLVAGMLLSAQSVTTPMNGGVLLCGAPPSRVLLRMLEGLDEIPAPVLYTKKYEHELIPEAMTIKPSIHLGNRRKIATALSLFRENVNTELLEKRLESLEQEIVTPAMFRLRLFERARSAPKTILLPEVEDDRILSAAELLLRRKVVKILLVGKEEEIARRSKKLGVDLSGAGILDPEDEKRIRHYAEIYQRLREHKGVTLEIALDRVAANKTLFATMALYDGEADGLVSGAIHSTRDTISPALQVIKTREGYPISSSCFFMCLPTKVLVYADCAINLDPTAEELAVIALETVETAQKFDIEPRVAMLSYSTGESGVGADVEKVRRATEILKQKRPDLPVAGPIQYDAAIDPAVAKIKMPDNPVAGHATIFIFPDLDTGNIAYKAVQRSSGAVAVGPVMQGLRRPVNDLSRGCSVDDIIDTVAITAVQAQEAEA